MKNIWTTRRRWLPYSLAVTIALIALATAFGPQEKTLGSHLPLVILHGAWVWTGKLLFAAAGLAGLAGLALRRANWQRLSQTLGRSGLLYWLTYLPMSLVVQQVNWGGIYWDEPRWRIPLAYGVVGLLLQIGLSLMERPALTCIANALFALGLWWQLGATGNVLHPDAPLFGNGAQAITVYFIGILALVLLSALQTTALLLPRSMQPD
jgi:hypothetical protein